MNSILAIIVLYNVKLEESLTFQSLSESLRQTSSQLDVLIYDNSEMSGYSNETYVNWNIQYVHNVENPGVSKAYNLGVKIGKKMGKKWVLLLDQDTTFPKHAQSTYEAALTKCKDSILFVPRLFSNGKLISPFKNHKGKGSVLSSLSAGKYSLETVMPINSGILMEIAAYDACGGYDEVFSLDYSDFAFIQRLKRINQEVNVLNLDCYHQFSGFNNTDKHSAKIRFKKFCIDTKLYKSFIEPEMNIHKILILRAISMTISFKSLAFLKVLVLFLIQRK